MALAEVEAEPRDRLDPLDLRELQGQLALIRRYQDQLGLLVRPGRLGLQDQQDRKALTLRFLVQLDLKESREISDQQDQLAQ